MEQVGPTTEALAMRARLRDADAFSALISRYERVTLSVAYSILGDADSAGDIVQDAFLRAWQRIADLKEPGRFATWLCGITRNLALDAYRRSRHVRRAKDAADLDDAELADHGYGANPHDALERREDQARVAAALQSLDELSRPAVILRFYDGLGSKEIGQVLGISPAAVDMRLSRARKQLRKLLESTEQVSHD